MVEDNRRSFLKWAIYGLSAVFGAVLGIPVIMYLIDPRHREAKQGDFRIVEGIDLTSADLRIDHPAFQHIGILSLEFHVDKLSRPLL